MKTNHSNPYRKTIRACYLSYISQSLICTFPSLLFLQFQHQYGIPLVKITTLITACFVLQLFVDFFSAFLIDKIGYRIAALCGNAFVAIGFCAMTILPEVFSDPFVGLMIAVLLYSTGSGLLEVVISPIVEACPNDNKEGTMSLLHSFFCWGCAAVIVLSGVFFYFFGTENWKIAALLWAIVPLFNAINFLFVPLVDLSESGEQLTIGGLLKNKAFWLFVALMACAGACEQGISQWTSAFVESELGIPKSYGDLIGPAMFAVTMGCSRLLYGKVSHKLPLQPTLLTCSLLCTLSYCLIAFVPHPIVALCGIALCGFSVGIMWPGSLSLASSTLKGGNALFAFLALAGDLGCSAGPTFVGFVAGNAGDNLRLGVSAALIFPLLMTIFSLVKGKKQNTPR